MSPKGFLVWTSEVGGNTRPAVVSSAPAVPRDTWNTDAAIMFRLRTWRHHDVQLQNPRSRTGGYMTPITNNARNYGGTHGLDTAIREQSPCRREHTYFAGPHVLVEWQEAEYSSRGNGRSEGWELRTRSWPSTQPPLGSISSSLTVFSLATHTFPCCTCLRSALAAGCPCSPGDGATGGGRSNPWDLVKAFLFFPV